MPIKIDNIVLLSIITFCKELGVVVKIKKK